MANYNSGSFKYSLFIIIILMMILVGLNYQKYSEQRKVVPVWSEYDREYFQEDVNKTGIINQIKQMTSPENIIYKLTKIRLNVPITYLKREIALLGYYTPEELQTSKKMVYTPDNNKESEENDSFKEEKMIRLQFDFSSNQEQATAKSKSNMHIAENIEPVAPNDSTNFRPVLAIYHTHTSETYIDDPRAQDGNGHVRPGNIGYVVKVGQELASVLSKKYNFKVIHSTKIHDESYTRSYYNSRQTVKNLLNNEPQINMLFDIHRDAVKSQARDSYTTIFNGKKTARVMIVVTNGKFDFAHLDLKEYHLEWQRNLNFAHNLASKMEEMYPGLLKKVEIRDTIYNQDLHPQALLLEIGDYQNTIRESLRSARMVADVIAAVAYSSQQRN